MNPIWRNPLNLEDLNSRGHGNMVEHLGILFTEIGADYLKATMPVDGRTKQPAGLLHGGASAAFAETIGSTAGNCVLDLSTEMAVGLEINANHLRSVREGMVEGICKPIHLGRTTQVWDIRITQGDKLVCVSRLTLSVLRRS